MAPGIGPKSYKKLVGFFNSASNVQEASLLDLRSILDESTAEKVFEFLKSSKELDRELKLIERHQVKVTFWDDPFYPEAFSKIEYPPQVFYLKGDLDFFKHYLTVSVVGTRKPTQYGKNAACDFTKELVESGFYTASGFALGIDTYAHRVTVESGSKTAAVLGCGLLVDYPFANRELKNRIFENGIVLSEFPLCYPPIPENFPRRNRLIAALGLGTLVVEADIKSGSMITVMEALNQGKDIFAVPGSIYSPYSRGTNRLISQGAKLVSTARDIICEYKKEENFEFDFSGQDEKTGAAPSDLTDSHYKVLDAVGWEPVNIEVISKETDFLSYELSKILLELELEGLIKALPGKQYIRNRK